MIAVSISTVLICMFVVQIKTTRKHDTFKQRIRQANGR